MNMIKARVGVMALGAAVWVVAAGAIVFSFRLVAANVVRPTARLSIAAPSGIGLSQGDIVYLATDRGLEAVGEVGEADPLLGEVELRITGRALARLSTGTVASCWRTPLSTEDTIAALLPATIQRQAAEQVLADWKTQDEQIARAWGPLVAELSANYLALVADDVDKALRRREKELWHVVEWHARGLAAEWPGIHDRLDPLVQQHLTPVLSRLLNKAITDAPKLGIALQMAQGNHEEAYRMMLNWLGEYLVAMSEEDQQELRAALAAVWMEACRDPEIVEPIRRLGERVFEDQRLRAILADVYREAITDNPKTADFLRDRVVESEVVRDRFYELVDLMAPTARRVLALFLFNERGAMRPEIVHLVRSAALHRSVTWVTLRDDEPSGVPLKEGAAITAIRSGAAR